MNDQHAAEFHPKNPTLHDKFDGNLSPRGCVSNPINIYLVSRFSENIRIRSKLHGIQSVILKVIGLLIDS
jgi:hypothetical protein